MNVGGEGEKPAESKWDVKNAHNLGERERERETERRKERFKTDI